MRLRLSLKVHEERDSIWAEVVELPGCFIEGKDLADLRDAFAEAVPMYLAELTREELAALPHDESPLPESPQNVVHAPFGKRPAKGLLPGVLPKIDHMRMLIEA